MSTVRAKPASRPVRRFRPSAAAVPTQVATAAEIVATSSELPSELSQTGSVKNVTY